MSYSCPECDSNAYKRNGFTRHGKQNHRCLDCGRQFSFDEEGEPMTIGVKILEIIQEQTSSDES